MADQTTDALQAALRLHRAGRSAEAKLGYESIVAADAGNAEAWHLLGVLAYQAGEHEHAVTHIDRAIWLAGEDARYFQNRGNALMALKRLDAAARDFERVQTMSPGDPDGPYGVGLCCLQQGDANAAAAAFEAALKLDPNFAEAELNLGLILERQGDDDRASRHLSRALGTLGDHLAGWLALARLLVRAAPPKSGELAAAVGHLGRLAKGDAEKLLEAAVLARNGEALPAALELLDAALAAMPDMAAAHFESGNVLYLIGRNEQAIAAFERALAIEPKLTRAAFPMAAALSRLDRFDEARRHMEAALEREPNFVNGHVLKAAFERRQGDAMAARAGYGRATALDPGNVAARWGRALALPPVYESEAQIEDMRAAWFDGIADIEANLDLSTPERVQAHVEVVHNNAPFYLHYQGRNDREPQRRFAAVVEKIARAAYPEFADFEPHPPAGTRRRVGFVSALWHWHTVHVLFKNWIGAVADDEIEPYIFYTGKVRDQAVESLAGRFPNFQAGFANDRELFQALAAARLDVIIYPDIGMEPATQLHAALRFAPRQWMSWGHPVTSGLPNMDGFLTSELMEPENGQDFYTESLIRLPNLSIDFDRPGEAAGSAGEPDRNRISCPQSLFKLLPSFDRLVVRIAQEAPQAKFRFIAHRTETVTRTFRDRLAGAFGAAGLDFDRRVTILPRLDKGRFFAEIKAAQVVLDPPDWSGGRTSLEIFACGRPIVTSPGAAMRGRHTAAMYARMGLDDLIAADGDAYVDLAVRWMTEDMGYRGDLARISQASPRLYGDQAAAAALRTLIIS
ncbi:MAG: tetratricopeptide repeat protein [Proteobacteria bacterium]|nr:tetratricopeptide repeat protein [Pseudomonadota bacterium]